MSDYVNENDCLDVIDIDESVDECCFSRDLDLAWAGGFIDGEGCITVANQTYLPKNGKQRPPTPRFKLIVGQNCWSTLHRLQLILNERGYLNEVPMTVEQNRRVYQLQYDGKHAYKAVKKLEPFLHRKRQYVSIADKLFEEGLLGQRPGRKGWDVKTLKAREKWIRRLRKLH